MHPEVAAARAATRVLVDARSRSAVLLHPSGLWIEIATGLLDIDPEAAAAIWVGIAAAVRCGRVGQHDIRLERLLAGTLVAELRSMGR